MTQSKVHQQQVCRQSSNENGDEFDGMYQEFELKECIVALERIPYNILHKALQRRNSLRYPSSQSDSQSSDDDITTTYHSKKGRETSKNALSDIRKEKMNRSMGSPNKTIVRKKKKLFSKQNEKLLDFDSSIMTGETSKLEKNIVAGLRNPNKTFISNTNVISYRNQKSISSSSEDYSGTSSLSSDETTYQFSDDGENVLFKCDDEISFNIPSSLVGLVTKRACRSDAFLVNQRRIRKKKLYSQKCKRYSVSACEEESVPSKISTRNEDLAAASFNLLCLNK